MEASALDHRCPRLFAALAQRLGPGIGVSIQTLEGQPESLFPAEAAIVTNAIPQRQREFAWGRTAARQAMRQLGWPVQPVASGPDRAPAWPTGLVGSISHCRTGCVALVARRADVKALGVDLEDAKALEPDLWELLFTARERAALQAMPARHRGLQATRLFSAKEAFYKWQYPTTNTLLDFQDAEVTWKAGSDRFEVVCERWGDTPQGRVSGHWLGNERWVLSWLVAREEFAASAPLGEPSGDGG